MAFRPVDDLLSGLTGHKATLFQKELAHRVSYQPRRPPGAPTRRPRTLHPPCHPARPRGQPGLPRTAPSPGGASTPALPAAPGPRSRDSAHLVGRRPPGVSRALHPAAPAGRGGRGRAEGGGPPRRWRLSGAAPGNIIMAGRREKCYSRRFLARGLPRFPTRPGVNPSGRRPPRSCHPPPPPPTPLLVRHVVSSFPFLSIPSLFLWHPLQCLTTATQSRNALRDPSNPYGFHMPVHSMHCIQPRG